METDISRPYMVMRLLESEQPWKSVKFQGFGREDRMRELWDRRSTGTDKLAISTMDIDWDGLNLVYPFGEASEEHHPRSAIYIRRPVGQIMPAPIWDVGQNVDLNYFERIGIAGSEDFWEDHLRLPGLFGMEAPEEGEASRGPRFIHYMSNMPLAPGEHVGLRSRFSLPYNPVICFALWRADPPDPDQGRTHARAMRPNPDNEQMPKAGDHQVFVRGVPPFPIFETVTLRDNEGNAQEHTVTGITEWAEDAWRVYVSPALTQDYDSGWVLYTETFDQERQFYSQFDFGITANSAWRLRIPYNAPAKLFYRHVHHTGNQWEEIQGDRDYTVQVMAPTVLRAGSDAHYTYIWVMQSAGHILVSSDGFQSNVGSWPTYVAGPSPNHPAGHHLPIEPGPVEFRHNAGEWGFAWVPMHSPAGATVQGPVMELEYPWSQYLAESGADWHTYLQGRLLRDDDGTIPEENMSVESTYENGYSRIPDDSRGFEWRVRLLVRTMHSEFGAGGAAFPCCRAPIAGNITYNHTQACQLYKVAFWNKPICEPHELGEQPALDTGIAARVSRSTDDLAYGGAVTLDGMDETMRDEFFVRYRPRNLSLYGAWIDTDGNLADPQGQVYAGQVGTPDVAFEGKSAIRLDAPLQSSALRLLRTESTGSTPPFDGWRTRDVVLWILDHLGLPYLDEYIEDTGTTLNMDLLGKAALWYLEKGRDWLRFLQELCVYDYMAGLGIDELGNLRKGCPYCGAIRKPDAEDPDYAPAHVSGGWGGRACFDYDVYESGNAYGVRQWITLGAAATADIPVELTKGTHEGTSWSFEGLSLEEEYFNHVVVEGAKKLNQDDPHSAEYHDPWSIAGTLGYDFALGHRKTLSHNYKWANRDALITRIAQALFARHACRNPAWQLMPLPAYCKVTIPFAPNLTLRDVAAIYGTSAAAINLDACRWRVIDLEHQIDQTNAPRATTLRCRYIGRVGDSYV